MSLTKASYSMITGAPVNVLDFGAVGDGVIDDTAAFNAAMASGENIYIPSGTYKISTLAVPNKKMLIHGDGIDATILQTTGTYGVNFDHFNSTYLNRFSVIENLTVNAAVGTTAMLVNNLGIRANNLYLYGGAKGLWIASSVLGQYQNIVAAGSFYTILIQTSPTTVGSAEVVWLNTFTDVSCNPNNPLDFPQGFSVSAGIAAYFFNNTLINLDVEKCNIGVNLLGSSGTRNTFINFWSEYNTSYHVFEAAGCTNTWINPWFSTSGGFIPFQINAESWYQDGNTLVKPTKLTQITWNALDTGVTWGVARNSPEGVLTAPPGSLYTNTVGGASTTLYVKESGTGNTGWVAK